jgi:hypothetical protein
MYELNKKENEVNKRKQNILKKFKSLFEWNGQKGNQKTL